MIIRDWRDDDRAAFAALNGDPEVMATLGPPMSRETSDALVDDLIARKARDGFTYGPVERREDGAFLGFVGLSRAHVGLDFDGMGEIGWRLNRASWGHGYATEAAKSVLAWAWRTLPGDQVMSMTARINKRSEAVMKRIGMRHCPERDFDHPRVARGSPLRPHIFYLIDRP
nr:GNAT family N-acetyltransferase [Pacificimonas pallii]